MLLHDGNSGTFLNGSHGSENLLSAHKLALGVDEGYAHQQGLAY